MIKVITVSFLMGFAVFVFGQSFIHSLPSLGLGSRADYTMALENEEFLLFRSYATQQIANRKDHLQIIKLDSCGIIDVHEVVLDETWGILGFHRAYMDGDTLRMVLSVNPFPPHGNHQELGLLSLDRNTMQGKYQYFQGRNVTYARTFEPLANGNYMLFGHVSYIDRKPLSMCIILDRAFNIVNEYTAYPSYGGSGHAIIVNDGYIVLTDETINKLDLNLNPVWSKMLSKKHYMYNGIKVADGIVVGMTEKANPSNEAYLVKFDFEGNILWLSPDFGEDGLTPRSLKLKASKNGDLHLFINQIGPSFSTQTMTHVLVNPENGNVILKERSENLFEGNDMAFKDFNLLDDGYIVCAKGSSDKTFFIKNELTSNDCSWRNVEQSRGRLTLDINDIPTENSISETYVTSSFPAQAVPASATLDIICENIDPVNFDLMASDSSFCEGRSMFVNLNDIPYEVGWNDGDSSKIKTLNTAGLYSYEYDVCFEKYSEEIIIETVDCTCKYYIPTAFSPNNDGINDVFKINFNCLNLEYFELQIFDRWGAKIFESSDNNINWDGTFKGKKIEAGVYIVAVKIKDAMEETERLIKQNLVIVD